MLPTGLLCRCKIFPRHWRESEFADGRHEQSELVRIARILSLLEPKVQKRNCSSVEQIQDRVGEARVRG